ncbi:MAG: glycosyltransferase family 4 protein [Clostridiales bacterium]|nr:glycosyltransferase family 4 protein [Clostridiales bacterium]
MAYTSKPRIAEFIRGAKGGMKKHYIDLIKGLVDSGIEVIAICNFPSKDRSMLKKLGAVVVPFAVKDRINPIRDIWAILKLARILRRHKVDIMHCHGFRAGMIGRIAALLARCRCIYTIHNFLPMNLGKGKIKIVAWAEKILSYFTKNIITVSQALGEEITQMLGVDSQKVKVIYNGIALPEISEKGQVIREKWGVAKDEQLIGTVARLIPSKGVDTLIEAVPLVTAHYPHIKFMVVGDGPQESFLKEKAEELNCSQNIIFTGYSEYIWYYYEAFDIFVLPSMSEGLGISVLEAMGMGKPVFAYRIGGIKEIIKHDWIGY